MTWKHLIDVAKDKGVEREVILRQAIRGERSVGFFVHTVADYIEWEVDPIVSEGVVVDRIRAAGEAGNLGYPVVALSIRELDKLMHGKALHGMLKGIIPAHERDGKVLREEREKTHVFVVEGYDDLLVEIPDELGAGPKNSRYSLDVHARALVGVYLLLEEAAGLMKDHEMYSGFTDQLVGKGDRVVPGRVFEAAIARLNAKEVQGGSAKSLENLYREMRSRLKLRQ